MNRHEDSPRQPMSQAEFARHCNVNRSSICRGVQNGLVIADADGRIDPAFPANVHYRRDVQSRKAEEKSESLKKLRRIRDELKRGHR